MIILWEQLFFGSLIMASFCMAISYGKPLKWLRLKVGGILYCSWCMSYWTGLGVGMIIAEGQWVQGIAYALALSALSSILMIPIYWFITQIDKRIED